MYAHLSQTALKEYDEIQLWIRQGQSFKYLLLLNVTSQSGHILKYTNALQELETDGRLCTKLPCIIDCGAVVYIMVTDTAWLAEAQYVGITYYLCLVVSVCFVGFQTQLA